MVYNLAQTLVQQCDCDLNLLGNLYRTSKIASLQWALDMGREKLLAIFLYLCMLAIDLSKSTGEPSGLEGHGRYP